MGTPLTGTQVSATYGDILKITDNTAITGALKTVSDGLGNDSSLQVSSAGVKSLGTLDATGNASVGGTLGVTGVATLSGNATVGGTLGVTGVATLSSNATVGGTLGVTGAVTLTVALPLTGGGTGATTASGARTALGLGTAAVSNTGDFDAAGAAAAVTAASCQRASNLSDVASASTSRTNLGLGTMATQAAGNVAITGGTVTGLTTLGSDRHNHGMQGLVYGGTVNLDMTAVNTQSVDLAGNITFTTSNRAAGLGKIVKVLCDGSTRTLAFPAWKFVGGPTPSSIAASKTGILSILSWGSNDTDITAAWAVES